MKAADTMTKAAVTPASTGMTGARRGLSFFFFSFLPRRAFWMASEYLLSSCARGALRYLYSKEMEGSRLNSSMSRSICAADW